MCIKLDALSLGPVLYDINVNLFTESLGVFQLSVLALGGFLCV